jgi:hypothetical protein
LAQERIAAVLTYLGAVWLGEANPPWPHVVLLSFGILAAFTVGIGILLESPKYSTSLHNLATWLVLGGIAIESLCTVQLFVFDERISARQDSIIISQQSRILALQQQTSNRAFVGRRQQTTFNSAWQVLGATGKDRRFPCEL